MRNTKKYTWKPDLPDNRDYKFSTLIKSTVSTLPPSVSLQIGCSPIEDQGQLGSCTANALVGAMEYNEKHQFVQFADFSRLFIYYNERLIEGTIQTDSGAMIRDGIKTLATHGVCDELKWKYDIRKWKSKPSKLCYKNALKNKITSYYRVNNSNLTELKQAIVNGNPIIFGFSVYESFESQSVATTGIVNMPVSTEKLLGGHAVLAVGYDDTTNRFLVKNSWGTNWGQSGYFTIPYDYLTNTNLADDFWVIVK